MANKPTPFATLDELHAKSAHTKRNKLSYKEKRFAEEIVKNKGNGTQAALAAGYNTTLATAAVIASENIRKPKVKAEIERLLERNGITIDEITQLHSRNARQQKHLPTSQGAIRDFYDILGMREQGEKANTVQVAFIIEKSKDKE